MAEDSAGYSKVESITDLSNHARWQAEIQAAEKELEKWKRNGRKIVKQFRAERVNASGVDVNFDRKFNLFSANVNILQTALLNQQPQPTVNREFKDPQDDVGRVACEILERAISAHNNRNFRTQGILKQVVQDMLTAGAGCSWHTYKADIETRTEGPTGDELAANPQAEAIEYDEVVSESLRDDYVYWEDLLWSPSRCWEEVRWLARKIYMTRDQLIERFGEERGKQVALDYTPRKNESLVETKNPVFQQAIIYEIWDKDSEKVIWFSKGFDDILDEKDDFLELDDFFPCPKPLFATVSNGQLIPIPDYDYARDQYRELNEINTRVALLVRACRVAGVYDKASGAVTNVLSNATENVLVPVDQWAAFAEKGGLKGVMDFLPLDQIVKTLEQLLKAREDVKQQIYEVTGMSDIIRGASKASETLGAQKIKAQYASMRIQERQKAVVEYCSTFFNIQVQLMRKHMGIEEIAKLAQVQFMAEDSELLVQAVQLIKNPEFILRCRVESDTLSDIDFQAEKQDRLDYMMTITNYLKETMQTIRGDPLLGPFLMQLLQFSLAGFKIGKKFEGELDRTFNQIQQRLANPQPPQPTPEQQKAQAEMQKMQAEMQLKMQLAQQDAQAKGQEMQFKAREHAMDAQTKQAELAMKAREQQLKLVGKVQEAQVNARLKEQEMEMSQAQFWQKMRQDAAKAQIDNVNAFIKGPGGGNAA